MVERARCDLALQIVIAVAVSDSPTEIELSCLDFIITNRVVFVTRMAISTNITDLLRLAA